MFFGAFIALVVDSALFEIGRSPFFATVFGVCLIVIGPCCVCLCSPPLVLLVLVASPRLIAPVAGGLILWRVAPENGERMSRWRWLVFLFSSLVFASGMNQSDDEHSPRVLAQLKGA